MHVRRRQSAKDDKHPCISSPFPVSSDDNTFFRFLSETAKLNDIDWIGFFCTSDKYKIMVTWLVGWYAVFDEFSPLAVCADVEKHRVDEKDVDEISFLADVLLSMPGLGLPADSCFDSDAFQFCAVSRLSATPFRSAIIFSRRFHFTLLPLLNTEAIFLPLRTAVSNSILSINNWSYCNDGFVYAVLRAGRPAGLPACLPAGRNELRYGGLGARALYAAEANWLAVLVDRPVTAPRRPSLSPACCVH
ncbi:hypothetical protein T12_14880 [Trichinella patagoniensis]|uniref:Uncharacterized protein n=1 Tax=Trichinella patagoniensis TaxID=990121 RepID=A0A0V0ZLS8_9BILA|nr:hypothetical protein T12_14880 [Trichinella patagoniensis]